MRPLAGMHLGMSPMKLVFIFLGSLIVLFIFVPLFKMMVSSCHFPD